MKEKLEDLVQQRMSKELSFRGNYTETKWYFQSIIQIMPTRCLIRTAFTCIYKSSKVYICSCNCNLLVSLFFSVSGFCWCFSIFIRAYYVVFMEIVCKLLLLLTLCIYFSLHWFVLSYIIRRIRPCFGLGLPDHTSILRGYKKEQDSFHLT